MGVKHPPSGTVLSTLHTLTLSTLMPVRVGAAVFVAEGSGEVEQGVLGH